MDVSSQRIASGFRQDNEVHICVVRDGLPDDAQVVGVSFYPRRDVVRFTFESVVWEGAFGVVNPWLTKLSCAPVLPVEIGAKARE